MIESRIIPEAAMPDDMDARIRRHLCGVFPRGAETFAESRSWHGSHPVYTAVLELDGDVIGHAGVVDRTIAIISGKADAPDSVSVRVAGVQNVFVLPEFRGRGLSGTVVRLAMNEAAGRGFDAGFLFCRLELTPVYSSCGWNSLQGRQVIRVENNAEYAFYGDKIAMYFPLILRKLPEGTVHLRGNDW